MYIQHALVADLQGIVQWNVNCMKVFSQKKKKLVISFKILGVESCYK
jgi:hypothetical protein